MKKRFLLVLAAFFASVALHAQFAQLTLLTPHYYPGEVYFVDGHSEEYAEVELPRVGKGKLGVKKNAEDKGHIDIDAANIVGIKIWHKNFPDKQHVLYYIHARKSMLQSDHQWGNPVMGSAWGVVFQCEQNYRMNKKTGDLEFVKFAGGNGPDTPTLFYLVRPEWEQAELVLFNGAFPSKNKLAELFAENEEIATAIKKGKLKGSDMQYILDEMAGDKKAEMPLKVIPEDNTMPEEKAVPETKTDSVSNGVVGDDE
jgi:hypothetical protein